MNFKAPWLKYYGETPETLNYPKCSMFEMVEKVAEERPKLKAYDFMGNWATYAEFIKEVLQCSESLLSIGIKKGDRVTICLPNIPQAIIIFYAVNRIGAIANMVHPLSAENEILFYLKESESKAAITLGSFFWKFEKVMDQTSLERIIVASIGEALPPVKRLAYKVMRKEKPMESQGKIITWHDFMAQGKNFQGILPMCLTDEDPAAILYSGGTTGTAKGILLTNLNFNALAMQTQAASGCFAPGGSMLAIMPIFHGFGLGVCIHTMLAFGGMCILVPKLDINELPSLFGKYKPNYMAGVPTLFEALLRSPKMQGVDLSCLKGVFSGGDSLSAQLKKKVDKFLLEHGSQTTVREGYGTTECVTASCLTPKNYYREGSIGIPFPDTFYKIVEPNTNDEVESGELGEICISGPSVMREYINNPKETVHTLRIHDDGMTWLHTGDLGFMDEDGFVYFRQRLKRMIISSGYNVYPSQIENVIDAHEAVLLSTVIGVKDDYRMQRIKAFIVLKPGVEPTEEVQASIKAHCEKNIAKYAIPREFEYRDSLPKTLVGKVAYTQLEKEEEEKRSKRA
ncbi:MAG: AMP-binding protein [Bacillota bacterium]|nr:AMP-binding protein [Bacillota bacterium]